MTAWTPQRTVVLVGRSFALTTTETVTVAPGSLPGTARVSWLAVLNFRWLLAWLACVLRPAILRSGEAAKAGLADAFMGDRPRLSAQSAPT